MTYIYWCVWILVNLTSKIFLWLYTGTEPGLEVRGGKSINKKKKKFETLNKYSFYKPSTKKNTQNYCFLRYYNAIIYENKTLNFPQH